MLCTATLISFLQVSQFISGIILHFINSVCILITLSIFTDITAPVMLGFELDLVTSVLAVVFDSGVDATSLDFTQITFTDGVDSESVTLTSGNAVTDIGIVIVVFITTNDQSLLSDHATICKSAASCYMSITSNFASDYSTNPVLAIPLDSSLPVCGTISMICFSV